MAYSYSANLQTAASLYFDKRRRLKTYFSGEYGKSGVSITQDNLRNFIYFYSDGYGDEHRSKIEIVLRKLFSVLDVDGNGRLDGTDARNFLLLFSGYTGCDNCGDCILHFGYACEDCWNSCEPSYNLCLKCYPDKVNCHRHRNFLPQRLMYRKMFQDCNKQVQCVVCGDFHRKDIRGVLIETHMVMDPESHLHVCEWCVTWSCSGCGKYFQGLSSNATPGRWMLTSYYCKACGATGDRTSIAPTIKAINESKVVRSCSTCRIKANKETLWSGSRSAANVVKTFTTLNISENDPDADATPTPTPTPTLTSTPTPTIASPAQANLPL